MKNGSILHYLFVQEMIRSFILCEFHLTQVDMQRKRETAQAKAKANQLFQQKQYEQHHHVIRVPKADYQHTYLDSLNRFSTAIDHDVSSNTQGKYLDTLSSEPYKKSTWGDYKSRVEDCIKKEDYISKSRMELESELNGKSLMTCKGWCIILQVFVHHYW